MPDLYPPPPNASFEDMLEWLRDDIGNPRWPGGAAINMQAKTKLRDLCAWV
jgi:hypothetical protein